MVNKNTDKELLRLAVITILIAGVFGVLQYYEDETFESVGIDPLLKLTSIVILKISFIPFMIYVILLGLSLKDEKKIKIEILKEFFYDISIYLTSLVMVMSSVFVLFIWILVEFPKFPMKIIVSTIIILYIVSAILITILLTKTLKKFLP